MTVRVQHRQAEQPDSATARYPQLDPEQDPHTCLAKYADHHPDDVLRLTETVSPDEGVTGLIYELAATRRRQMLMCDDVTTVAARVVSNVFASRERIARFLGTDVSGLHETFMARTAQARPLLVVDDGPVLEHVTTGPAVDLAALPMLRHFASDAAAYITSGIVVGVDPETGKGNLSYHRSMVHSRNQLSTSLHSRGDLWRMLQRAKERDEVLPVAMVIGGHPLFMLAASSRVGYGVDEREIAGGLMGGPLQVIRTPVHGIEVPAWSDLVLEGTIDPDADADEGPFGEFSGYSSDRSTRNVITVDAVLRRDDPWLIDVEGGNTDDHLNLARIPRESEMVDKLRTRFPDVTAVAYPTSGTHFHAYVALRAGRPGQARQVMLGLLGWDPYLKTVVAVDDDVDITNDSEVLWALATHFQPHRDLFVVDGLPGSPLDPSADAQGTTSRMGLDATRGPDFHGERIVVSDGARQSARRLIGTYDAAPTEADPNGSR